MTLRDDLNDLINRSHGDAWITFDWVLQKARTFGLTTRTMERWKTPGEPAFVSNLLEYPFAHYRLRRIIAEHLQPAGLCNSAPLVSGVFIHQKPKVCFGHTRKQIELGDLLLVRQHFQSGVAMPQGRAFLVQAKSSDKPHTGTLSGNEAHQFALYANWATRFTFPHKELGLPPDGSKHWDFSKGPGPVANTGFYGIVANARPPAIAPSFPSNCAWAIGTATNPPAGVSPSVDASGLSLAEALEGFLLGTWGRTWDAVAGRSDHWSWFVQTCLSRAAAWKDYPVKRLHAGALPRRRDVLAFVDAFSAQPIELNIAGPTGHRYRDMVFKLEELIDGSNAVSIATNAWLHTVESMRDNDDDGDGEPPTDADVRVPGARKGGVSVLYVATFGDRPLEDPQPIPEAEPVEQHSELRGSW